ncbi:hypothetical protein SCL18_15905, partial [Legionella pneumophila serogroup 1]
TCVTPLIQNMQRQVKNGHLNHKHKGGVMFNLKRNLIKLGTLSISIALLAACHTVKGTVTGAKQDIKATGKAISRTMQ